MTSELEITMRLPEWKILAIKGACKLLLACAWFLEKSLNGIGFRGEIVVTMTYNAEKVNP